MTTRRGYYPGEYEVTNDGAKLILCKRGYGFHIYSLKSHVQRRGYATRLLRRIMRLGVRLTLDVGAFAPGMNNAQLLTFYKSLGFTTKYGSFMEWNP